MNKEVEDIAIRISNMDISQKTELLGDAISDILLTVNKAAIYVDNEKNKIELLLPVDTNASEKQMFILKLTELLAFLDDMKKNRLIFVTKEDIEGEHFFYQGKACFEKNQRPNVYKIAEDTYLNVMQEGNVLLTEKGRDSMIGVVMEKSIGDSLAMYLESKVLPTQSLKDFVRRGFKTKEEQNTQRGLRYSIISMAIAVCIAAISPVLSVFVSNRFGVNTLNQQQLDSLWEKVKPMYIIPTVEMHDKGDSVRNHTNIGTKNKEHGYKKI